MLFVIMVSGMMYFTNDLPSDDACRAAAKELNSTPSIQSAFCVTHDQEEWATIGKSPLPRETEE